MPMIDPAVELLTSSRTVRLLSPVSIPRFGRFVGPSSSSDPSCEAGGRGVGGEAGRGQGGAERREGAERQLAEHSRLAHPDQ